MIFIHGGKLYSFFLLNTGIGRALVYTPSVIAVGIYFNKRRGIAVGLSTSGVGFGCFLFPPTIELLFNYYGFFWTFVILSAVISNFFVCGALFRPLELQWKLMEYKRLVQSLQSIIIISDGYGYPDNRLSE